MSKKIDYMRTALRVLLAMGLLVAQNANAGPSSASEEQRVLRAPWAIKVGDVGYLDDGVATPNDERLWFDDLCDEPFVRQPAFVKWMNEHQAGLVCDEHAARALARGMAPALLRLAIRTNDPNPRFIAIFGKVPQRESRAMIAGGWNFTESEVEKLSFRSGISAVALHSPHFSPDALRHLRRLTNLRSLVIICVPPAADSKLVHLNDDGLAHVGALSSLRELSFDGAHVTEKGLRHLRALPNLVHLAVAQTELDGEGLAHLGKIPSLRSIEVMHVKLDVPLPFAGLSELRSADFSFTDGMKNAAVLNIGSLAKLRTLKLSSARVTDEGLARLASLTELRTLSLDRAPVTDAGLVHLTGLRRLRKLSLRDTAITDEGLVHIGKMSGLRELDIEGTAITSRGLAHLKELRELQTLNLARTRVSDLSSLSSLSELRHLDLSLSHVDDKALAAASGLARLRRLELSGTNVTDQGLLGLHKFLTLRELVIESEFVPSPLASLRKALPGLSIVLRDAH